MIGIELEEEILNEQWRKYYLECLSMHQERKLEAKKRQEIYKDLAKKWVIKQLSEELGPDSLKAAKNRASNISICKKIINKTATVYQSGVLRTVEDATSQVAIDALSDEMDFNTIMRNVNALLELHKNLLVQVIPQKNNLESIEKELYDIIVRYFHPEYYDPILDYHNPKIARGFVLSDFIMKDQKEFELYQGQRNKKFKNPPVESLYQIKNPEQTFIWWTNKYHFTTDEDGKIISELSPEDLLNPIGLLPFVHFNMDQENKFFSCGGEDLIDGSILINILLTSMYTIADAQGWGQPVVTGKNLPKRIGIGPQNAIILEHEAGDPQPSFQFVSSNPPIGDWLNMIEQHTALLLTTNNLSSSNVSMKLDANNFPSGIAMLIERSEINFDLEDKQKIFQDKEPLIWNIVKLWQNLYFGTQSLSEEFMEIGSFEDSDVNLKFPEMKQVIGEKEKLEILKMRKELGLNTEEELMKMDNPDLTEDEVKAKMLELSTEKMKSAVDQATNIMNQPKDGMIINKPMDGMNGETGQS